MADHLQHHGQIVPGVAVHDQDMSMMKSYFHFGYGDQFMFKTLIIDCPFTMWAVCGVMFGLVILFEFIKYLRCVRCGCPSGRNTCPSVTDGSGDCRTGPDVRLSRSATCYVGHLRTRRHRVIQTVLHTTQTTLGLLIMLAAMSFNICIIFAILVGTAVGHYVFYRPYNEVEAIESCH